MKAKKAPVCYEGIAIIGASCRFPGEAHGLDEYWNLLSSGVDAVTELPEGRFSLERYINPNRKLDGHSYTAAAGVLDNIKDFDAQFFGISRKEAQYMDPQQRLVLESAWEALEQAGILPASLRGSDTGVFIGASNVDQTLQGPDDPCTMGPYSMTGSTLSIIANRVSYFLDLHGPSFTVDTACSSSLTAIHQACLALHSGESSLAIAGGVNVLTAPFPFIGFSKARMLSPTGRCKVFDASGDGYVRAEGVGTIILKPLAAAKRDKDTILAVIVGSGVNSDGRTTGISLPNEKAQAALLTEIYSGCKLDKEKLVYVEAHGTGTAAGDPIEASAIGTVLGKALAGKRILPVGSAKSNIGHLESASGMAGLIKALLVLKNGKIPPNLHLANPNPAIDFSGLNLTVPTKLSALPKAGGEELVGINSFGFGGTNAHIVLQKAPKSEKKRVSASRGKTLPPLFLCARSDISLKRMAEQYLEKIEGITDSAYYDLAAAAVFQREAMPYRSVITGKSLAEIAAGLKKLSRSESSYAPQIPQAAQSNAKHADSGFFAFSGNGSQWIGMGAALIAENEHFAQAIREIDTLLAPLQGWSCEDMLTNTNRQPDVYELTEINQPLLFAVQVAVVETLKARGLRPQGVTGHSVGEVAAAWASGALSLKDAVTVIHHRSRLQGKLKNKGSMAVAEVSPEKAKALLQPFGGAIEITAINTDSSITVAGPTAALKSFIEQCKAKRVTAKMLAIAYPFHTSAMDDIKDELLTALAGIKPQKPSIPFYSTVHGKATTARLDAAYWWNNLRKPVLFSAAVKDAYAKGFRRFMEIGPSPVLRSYFRKLLAAEKGSVWVYPVLLKAKNEILELESAWKNAWRQGWSLNMRVHFPTAQGPASLPVYPWDREFLWSEDTPENRGFLKAGRIHPLLGWPLPGNPGVFENTIQPASYPWLGDHVAGNGPIYPAAAFIESMLAAAAALPLDGRLELERVNLFRALPLSDDAPKSIRISVDKEDGGLVVESKTYMSSEPWSAYARGRVVLQSDTPAGPGMTIASPESFGVLVDKEVLYKTASRFLLHYGPAFQSVSKAWVRSDSKGQEVLARLSTPVSESAEGMFVPPTLTDGALQTLFILLGTKSAASNSAYLPVFFDRVILHSKGCPAYVHGRLERTSPRSVVASFKLLDATGKELLCLNKCRFRRAVWLEQENVPSEPYTVEMAPSPRPDAIRPLTGLATASLAKDIAFALSPVLASGRGGDATNQGTHAYMLLQLAALSAMHETVLSLCGGPEKELNCNCHDLLDSGALSTGQEAWFNYMMERLQSSGLAAREGDGWRVFPRGSRPSAEALWRTVLSTAPGFLPEATLLGHVFKRHEQILGGKYADKEHELLPQRLIDNYFLHSLALQPFGEAAKCCVASVLRSGKSGQLINIMQISKNSTGLVTDILPLLDKRPCQYVVAEKDAPTAEARALTFGNVPGLSFCAFDLENPSEEHASRYHLIILGWSAHEHLDHATVLANCRAMLAPGGILCLIEHSPTAFANYTFGSRPSWWAASTHVDRPVSLLTDRAHWADLLDKSGLRSIALTRDTEGDHLPAFILLAQKPERATDSAVQAVQAEVLTTDEPGHAEKILLVSAEQGSESAELADALGGLLEKQQASVHHVRHGAKIQGERFDLASGKSWERLFKGLPQGKNQPAVHIVYLAAYDTRDELAEQQFAELQFTGTAGLMELVKAWDARKTGIRITVIAGGALADGVPTARPVPSQGAISGFTRVLMNEQRGLETRFIDLHGKAGTALDMLPEVAQELLFPEKEPEIMLAGGIRFAPRLQRLASRQPAQGFGANQGATLSFDMPGRLQNLYWKATPIPQPGKGEVCIEVKYTGLNYRDVLWSMGMLLDEALENGFSGPTMGIECSGTIVAVGQGVKGWSRGDAVLCFSPAGFSSHVITSASAITRKPDNISFAEAAGIPVAFITAWYSIKHMARMQRGEKLLIHGAAGGVGLAAVQIAAHLGLEVYATAGAPEKQNVLRQLGVKHIYSSRSLAFAKQIMDQTNGSGVDAVLNSLAGEAIPAGLSVLKPFGRFMELGKRDFYADTPMRLRPFSNNISYFGVDVDQLLVYQPALAKQLFAELMELFVQRKLAPLPQTVYPVTKTLTAFQTMQQSTHIGKIVVSMDGATALAQPEPKDLDRLELSANATYLVTGGTGGLGLASAARLARRGAKNLLLLSRSGVREAGAQKIVDGMAASGVRVVIVKVDVADSQKLGVALKKHLKKLPPLKGVIHAAAVLDDGVVTGLDAKRLQTSFHAKSLGAYALHNATAGYPLDFFVLYSSVSAAFGNPGQAGYVAANCMLESLAAWRKSKGLPAQVIGWGAIDDTGMVTRNDKVKQVMLKVLGVSPTHSTAALYWLEHCIRWNIPSSYFFGVDWHTRANIPILDAPRFSSLRPRSTGKEDSDRVSLEELRTLEPDKAIEKITGMLVDEIAHVLRMPKDRLTPDTPLITQGMDSLMAVELSLAVEQKFEITGYTLPLSDTTTAITLAESLFSIITGAGAESSGSSEQPNLEIFAHKHGFELSDEQKGEVLESLQKDTHERR